MILLIDNYDSFSYNLYQMVGEFDPDILVIRNDALTVAGIEALQPGRIILSPGPGRPSEAGVCEAVARHFAGRVPVLGVCLGHQAICEAFGATITHAITLMHGKSSEIQVDPQCALFAGLPNRIQGGRYHSLAAVESTLPAELLVTARTTDGEVMAVQHRDHALYGLQFHPESILTPLGREILKNFVQGGCAHD